MFWTTMAPLMLFVICIKMAHECSLFYIPTCHNDTRVIGLVRSAGGWWLISGADLLWKKNTTD
jgi:hypothetical protein